MSSVLNNESIQYHVLLNRPKQARIFNILKLMINDSFMSIYSPILKCTRPSHPRYSSYYEDLESEAITNESRFEVANKHGFNCFDHGKLLQVAANFVKKLVIL